VDGNDSGLQPTAAHGISYFEFLGLLSEGLLVTGWTI